MANNIKIEKANLENFYIRKGMSPYTIAPYFSCDPSTIRRYLFLYKIPVRKKKLIKVSKEELKYLYCDKKLNLKQVGEVLGCTPAGILKILRKLKILIRNKSEASKYYSTRIDFDGDKLARAYMIGFRLGDLHVRKIRKLIRVGGGTTKEDQVELFRVLFGKYGHIYIGNRDKRGAWHPEVGLNESFNFLLPKHKNIPKEIKENKDCFINFVAGYTDAEGNIGCYPRARFKITSYDYGILRDIKTYLKKYFNIHCNLCLEKLDRKDHNNDALSLTINEVNNLSNLLKLLDRLLKHGKRKDDLAWANQNIISRQNV